MRRAVFSSETYPLAVADVLALPDANAPQINTADEIVIMLGRNSAPPQQMDAPPLPDTLIKGRGAVERAAAAGEKFVPVRFAFSPANAQWDVFSAFIRKYRNKIRFYGSNVYHVPPAGIRALKIERAFKTRETAYSFTAPIRRMTRQERDAEYDRISDSIKENGFLDSEPIDIMLRRLTGAKDCVNNGHHRLGIALELGLDAIPVNFSASAVCPAVLHPVLRLFSTWNLAFKRRFQK